MKLFNGLVLLVHTLRVSVWISDSHGLYGDIGTVVGDLQGPCGQVSQGLGEVTLSLGRWGAWRHNAMISNHTPKSIS